MLINPTLVVSRDGAPDTPFLLALAARTQFLPHFQDFL
jgi:hypothetical protein